MDSVQGDDLASGGFGTGGPSSNGAVCGGEAAKPKIKFGPDFDFPRRRRVPPPFKCSKGDELGFFFRSFEKFVSGEYSSDEEDWRLVLPDYLEGDLLRAVKSFKAHEKYGVIKNRLLKDFAKSTKITGSSYSDLLEAKKQPNESMGCFQIRLEGMVEGLGVDEFGKQALLLKALERNTEECILTDIKKLQIVAGKMNVERYVELYREFSKLCISKSDNFVAAVEYPPGIVNRDVKPDAKPDSSPDVKPDLSPDEKHDVRSDAGPDGRPAILCYKCNGEGHFARHCSIDNVDIVCYACQQPGHVMRQCPSLTSSNNAVPLLFCGFCGRPGHAMVRCREFNNFRAQNFNFGKEDGFQDNKFGPSRGMGYGNPQSRRGMGAYNPGVTPSSTNAVYKNTLNWRGPN